MNSLSWLLYVADVLPSVSSIFFAFSCVLLLAGGLLSFVGVDMKLDGEGKEDYGTCLKLGTVLLSIAIPLILLSSLIPKKETFYLIAASEAGEEVIDSPEVDKTRKIINSWLDNKLEELKTNGDEPTTSETTVNR